MPGLLTDPAFWLAVVGWMIVLLFALGLCVAAARGDDAGKRCRADVSERERVEALRRIQGGGGSGWWKE